MKTTTYKIKAFDGVNFNDSKEVSGTLYGPFGLRKNTHSFVIDHIPTGGKIAERNMKKKCVELINKLMQLDMDWSRSELDYYSGKGSLVREILSAQ